MFTGRQWGSPTLKSSGIWEVPSSI